MKTDKHGLGKTRRRGEAQSGKIFAPLCGLCSAISQHRRVRRRFSRSADSLVRESRPARQKPADKAVRAPLVAAPPRCASAFAFVIRAHPCPSVVKNPARAANL